MVDGKQDVVVRVSHIVGDADVTVTSEGNLTIVKKYVNLVSLVMVVLVLPLENKDKQIPMMLRAV